MSPVEAPGVGGVDVGEERVGWTFLSFPNANTKNFQDISRLKRYFLAVHVAINRIDRIKIDFICDFY